MKIYNYSTLILFQLFVCARLGFARHKVTKEFATKDEEISDGILTETPIKTNPTTPIANPTRIKTNPTTTKANPTTTKANPTTTKANPTTTNANPTITKVIQTTPKAYSPTSKVNPTISKANPATSKANPATIKANPTTTQTEPSTTKTPITPSEVDPVGGTGIADDTENVISGITEDIDQVIGEKEEKEADRKETTGTVADVQHDDTSIVKLFEVSAITAGICLILLLLNFIQLILVIRIFGRRQKDQTVITPTDVPQIVITKGGPSMQTLVELENQKEIPPEGKTDQPESNHDKDEEPLKTSKEKTDGGEDETPTDVKTESQKTSPVTNFDFNQAAGAKLNASEPLNEGADKPPTDTTVIDLDDFPPPPDVADLSTEAKPNESEGVTSLAATEDPSKTIASLEEEVKRLVEFADNDAPASN